MSRTVPGVLASYVYIDGAAEAILALRAGGHGDLTVYSAAPSHDLEDALGITNSPVRLFTLFGGLIGCTAGFAMAIWMSRDWPLLVGGKPIAAIPPFVVFGFELMVLIGALSTVAGLIILSLFRRTTGLAYDPAFSDDRVGIFVPARPEQVESIETIFRATGAAEVRRHE